MFESIATFFKKIFKPGRDNEETSKDTAKERLHLVLMQDRANVSADFLDLMKQEIIEVIKKYIDVDEKEIDVRLTNQSNEDGTNGAPALYANIPIINIKNDVKGEKLREQREKISEDVQNQNEEVQQSEEEKQEEIKEKEIEEKEIEEINAMVEDDEDEDEENDENLEENSETVAENESDQNVEENSDDKKVKTEEKSEN